MDAALTLAIDAVTRGLADIGGGDPTGYRECWAPTDDSTLLGAWGTVERGQVAIGETLDWVANRFRGGELTPEYDVVYEGVDLAYTVGFERGVVRIDGQPPRELVIRVTHIYRKFDDLGWRLVHRHADHPPVLTERPRL